MKEDYLWNKTGGDAEIERLENALKVFRYQETAPPALPAKIVPFERKNRAGFFRLILSFGALAAMAIVCLGIWLQFLNKNIETVKDEPQIVAPTNQNPPQAVEIGTRTDLKTQLTDKIETPKHSIERQFVAVKKVVPQIVNRKNPVRRNIEINLHNQLTARQIETPKPAVKLSAEETYAYNQLVLALSITGSQLKIVKDKIDAVENSR